MNLPLFLHPSASHGTSLPDAETRAYRALLGRWLIDLARLLGWDRCERGDRLPDLLRNDVFLKMTGIPEGDAETLKEESAGLQARVNRLLKQRRAALARTRIDPALPLLRNLSLLTELLGLTQAEQAVLCFALFLAGEHIFQRAIRRQSSEITTPLLHQILARLTGLPVESIRAALKPDGILVSTGLLQVRPNHADLEHKFDVRDDLQSILFVPHEDGDALMAHFLKRSPQCTLTLANFSHLRQDTEAAGGLLRKALANRVAGTNLLLYGPPGVGKTEYAAVLAAAVGADLYEVDYADEDGDPIRGEQRLRAFNLCQRLLARRDNALLLFDETEDVFERNPFSDWFGQGGNTTAGKAWINRSLENNPVPALWITNDAEAMDGAYLRRFDYSIRFGLPPKAVRLTIVCHHLGEHIRDPDWLAQLAAHEHLTPAQLARAAKMARLAGEGDPDKTRELVLQTLDRSALLLQQHRAPNRQAMSTGYDLRYLNTDQDIPRLIAALKRRPQGIFCFHGPAGTGKSELARHIAEELDQPLLVKRASDLLSKYLGETEQLIAAMFTEARQQDAVLVLDEADSFLRDRRGARYAWEVTQVNELLTQMEFFDGIFIATTNLMDSLDTASLRRFPWKIRFHWLTSNQCWGLFLQEYARLGGDIASAASWQQSVRRLNGVAPGDFAAVVRQYELWDEVPAAGAFYDRLRAELAAKEAAAVTDQRCSTADYVRNTPLRTPSPP